MDTILFVHRKTWNLESPKIFSLSSAGSERGTSAVILYVYQPRYPRVFGKLIWLSQKNPLYTLQGNKQNLKRHKLHSESSLHFHGRARQWTSQVLPQEYVCIYLPFVIIWWLMTWQIERNHLPYKCTTTSTI